MPFPPIHQFICKSMSPKSSVATRENLQKSLTDRQIDCMKLAKILGEHLITPTYYVATRKNGLIQYFPDEFQTYLETVYELNAERNQEIKKQLQAFLHTMAEIGVKPVLLKGAITFLEDDTYEIGERIMSDIDVLIPKDQIHAAVKKLYSRSYRYFNLQTENPVASSPCDEKLDPILFLQQQGRGFSKHISPLYHRDYPVTLELHHELVSKHITQNILEANAVIARRCGNLPALEDRILHNFMHTQIDDHNSAIGRISLRQLYTLTKIMWAYDEKIDWQKIYSRIQFTKFQHSLTSYLLTADELFGLNLPKWVRSTPKARVIRIKQTLYHKYPWCQKMLHLSVLIAFKIHTNLAPTQAQIRFPDVSLTKSYYLRAKQLGKRMTRRRW